MIEEKLKFQLKKEVLRRANKQEKQEHENISKRQSVIAEKDVALVKKWDALSERSKRNEYPKETAESKNHKHVSEMTMDEFNNYMAANRKYTDASFACSTESMQINSERLDVLKEVMESIIELWNLGDEEKWLLLSIALRSQPNLLKYTQ